MFTSLRLKHFKAWRDSGDLRLAPVTLLLGSNSTGKSALLQSLLLLRQTVASPDRMVHLNLGGDEVNDFFNFGHFEDVLTKGATPRQVEIAFSFRRAAEEPEERKGSRPAVTEGRFHVVYGMTSSRAVAVQQCTLTGPAGKYQLVRKGKGAYSVLVGDETAPRGKSRTFAPERSIALPAEAIQLLGPEGGYAEDLSLSIRRELEAVAYLGPLRRKSERDYVWNKTRPGDLGVDGAGAISALFASAYLRAKNGGDDVVAGVSKYLARMGVAERIEIRQIGHSTRYEIVVHRDGVEANLRDVGTGIAQVLPVLTLAFFAPRGTSILLEEPEIHLHPLAQAVLAELFVEISRERGVQFIVETHSEHLFRRLQTLIAKNALSVDDCTLYFVERERADAKLRTLEVNEAGAIANWPPKFFGDALGETREQARLMFERQQQESGQ